LRSTAAKGSVLNGVELDVANPETHRRKGHAHDAGDLFHRKTVFSA
jgi:hypothetical protein